MFPLRFSTATQIVPLGPFVSSTDGNTGQTALTIANTDIKLLKGGATSEVSKNSGGATHIADGRYYATFDATDTGTLGSMRVSVHVAGALYVWLDCVVYPQAVYDALFTGTGAGVRSFIPAGSIDTDAIDANSIKADAVTEIQSGLLLASSYTAPDNAGVATIVGKLPAGDLADEDLVLAAIATRLATSGYTVPPTTTAIADALLARRVTGGANTGRTVSYYLQGGTNKVAFDTPGAGQFTVYALDDATPLYVGTYTRGAPTDGPLVSTDPG